MEKTEKERALTNEQINMLIQKILEGEPNIESRYLNRIRIIENFSYSLNGKKINRKALYLVPVKVNGKIRIELVSEDEKSNLNFFGFIQDKSITKNEEYKIARPILEEIVKKCKVINEEIKENEQPSTKNSSIESQENKEKNLTKLGISISSTRPQIKLDRVIDRRNGNTTLYNLMQLRHKLKGQLPPDVSEKHFEDGYFSWVQSSELTAKDGKYRKGTYTPVIRTKYGSVMVELDETILKYMPRNSKEKFEAAQNNKMRNEYGIIQNAPKTEEQETTVDMWEIQGARENENGLNLGKYYRLAIRKKEPAITGERKDLNGFEEELFLGRGDRENFRDELNTDKNISWIELSSDIGKKDKRNFKVADKSLNEEHRIIIQKITKRIPKISRKILDNNTEISSIYNEADITNKIRNIISSIVKDNYDKFKDKNYEDILDGLTEIIEIEAENNILEEAKGQKTFGPQRDNRK